MILGNVMLNPLLNNTNVTCPFHKYMYSPKCVQVRTLMIDVPS